MTRILFWIGLFVFSFHLSFGQSKGVFLKNALSQLQSLKNDRPIEKVYLHFDKPYYVTGDTIYFKAYVTLNEQHRLSTLSEVLHAELITPENKILRSLKLQLRNGVAWADFAIPDSLPKGNYRVRAYTKWMLNEGKNYVFDQIIRVGSTKPDRSDKKLMQTQNRRTRPVTDFFPEGGTFLIGIESKVAFKAIDARGLGTQVKGIIVDNSGREITRFQSAHLGMGYFYLKPEEGKTYRATLTYKGGEQAVADLPKAETKGMVLSINDDSLNTTSVRVLASNAYYAENQNQDISLLLYSFGVPTTMKVKLNSPEIKFQINKQHFHSGIMQITLFSPKEEPLSERLNWN
jgi:hypothetical protein